MNNVSAFAIPGQEASSAQPDLLDVNPGKLEELVHELRQPLSVIESLAYYLEMTVPDKSSCTHLQRIRAMLRKTHAILEQARISAGAESVLAGSARSLLQEH
jgi:signal transduction histidine kinase